MNVEAVRGVLEEELALRWAEMRHLSNQVYLVRPSHRKRFRRALVVMLYAHLEGFAKSCLGTYAHEVNRERLKCGDANDALATASLANVFRSLASDAKPHAFFRNKAPEDSKLHAFARQKELTSRLSDLWSQSLDIPIDEVVDTESNLSPLVLRKILFRLGFPHDAFATEEGTLNRLLEERNNIAHGRRNAGYEGEDYRKIEKAVYAVLHRLMAFVTKALIDEEYKR